MDDAQELWPAMVWWAGIVVLLAVMMRLFRKLRRSKTVAHSRTLGAHLAPGEAPSCPRSSSYGVPAGGKKGLDEGNAGSGIELLRPRDRAVSPTGATERFQSACV